MDKYEKLAEEYICGSRIFSVDGDNAKALADAFRWYDERREKETCEWTRGKHGWYSRSCEAGITFPKPDNGICTTCSRRIVEVKHE